MSEHSFTIDLGKIMDEAFRAAQGFGQAFEEGLSDEMRERFRRHFRGHDCMDFYPHYSYPPMNIYLTRDRSLVFEIALAGFEEKGISLEFKGDHLVLSAKAPAAEAQGEGLQYFKRRLKLKDIEEQRFLVPEDKFDREKVQARFRNGLLKVVIPARQDAAAKEGTRVRILGEEDESPP